MTSPRDLQRPICRICNSKDVKVTRTQQRLKSHGKNIVHASIECNNCGHEWWSRNKWAVAESRRLDKEAIQGEGDE